jgi:hypothetical protein
MRTTLTNIRVMNEQVLRTIRYRSRQVNTKEEMVTAIFDSFREWQIDLHDVSLEDMKIAVVVAAREIRSRGDESLTNMLA